MASPALLKLLRNQQTQSATKTLTYLLQPPPLSLTQISKPYDTPSFSNHSEMDQSTCAHIYPTFPFGFFLDPISPTQLIRSEPDEEMVPEESAIIRADSVKKKRKKKMNKHKLRKLRKCLRRKTKT